MRKITVVCPHQKNTRAKTTYGMDPSRKEEERTPEKTWIEDVQAAMIARGLETDQWMVREVWHVVSSCHS